MGWLTLRCGEAGLQLGKIGLAAIELRCPREHQRECATVPQPEGEREEAELQVGAGGGEA
jgi:hypothetical protein